ncbi:penicillin-binding transpeptidase domain-containing protein [Natronincola ferrireducens]|uniref:Penicillin-binding protein 2 n=1 Tax=Natronincola ferrireducens TaxID=393762 RepID=A0A1G9D2T9_9FIRM|nr:penicillin-binding transpeptidase domain-containing protein [Natronincola ferrireducens]SDK58143.1 penicillin-binding protein 2 [Natronincola ferrireducens]
MIFKKLKNRYNVIILTYILVFVVILFRLATIMIVQGEEYREQAENRIIKTIPLPAARGEIRDRYGRLLAGNRPSFTVQIMKNEVIDEKINEVSLKLINILEKNEDKYNDEFPIIFSEEGEYVFTYDLEIQNWKERNDLLKAGTAQEAFEMLRRRYGIEETDPGEVQQQLIRAMGTVPITISRQPFQFIEEMRKEQWLQSYNITDKELSAYEAFQIVRNNVYKIPEEYSDVEARKIMVVRELLRKQGYLQYQPVRIAQDLSEASVTEIEEKIMSLPGVNIAVEPVRYYPEDQRAAHVLGNLGKISQQNEIDKYVRELGYLPSDIIGKTGIEHSFEETLKGQDGSQRVVVDSRGRLIKVLEIEDPIPGDGVYLTLDANLQRVAEETLEEVLKTLQAGGTYEGRWGTDRLVSRWGPLDNATSGSVVVTDIKTGEVLAMANYPAYDPNLFATGISSADWNSLMPENERDPLAPRPLTNIATSTAIQPGSTFKMIVGLAGIEQGLSPNYRILDRGFIQVGGHSFGNWLWNQSRRTMGYQGLHEAIADSNNYYFYSVANGYDYGSGRYLPIKMNTDILTKYTKMFGLNDRTGIEIQVPRERSGGVPSIENKTRTIKAMLRRHLERQMKLDDLDDTKVEATEEVLKETIEQIVSWAEENPSRGEVYRRMVDLGIKEDRANIYTDICKYSYFTQARWSVADTMNFAIGQGEHSYTPLQMANYMAILANGGYRYNLSLVRKTQSYDGESITEFPPELVERIELKDYKNLDEVNYGMYLVNKTGSARSYFRDFPIDVAGKTGTAQRSGKIPPVDEIQYLKQHLRAWGVSEAAVEHKMAQLMEENKDNPRYEDESFVMREAIKALNPRANLDQFKRDYDNYAWYTGFAPYDDPQIAISVLIFQGGSGGYGAPIFREIVAEYMGLNTVVEQDGIMIENRLTP